MRKRSRSEHHKSIKYINKNIDLVKRVSLLNVAVQGGNNLFTEIHKIKHAVKLVSTPIDGQRGDSNIAECFSDKYEHVFNFPNSNTYSQEYATLLNVINYRINTNMQMLYQMCLS